MIIIGLTPFQENQALNECAESWRKRIAVLKKIGGNDVYKKGGACEKILDSSIKIVFLELSNTISYNGIEFDVALKNARDNYQRKRNEEGNAKVMAVRKQRQENEVREQLKNDLNDRSLTR